MKLDSADAKIIKALVNDGRASLRDIAKRTSLTTPTVSSRFERMKKAGLIKKFIPVLSSESLGHGEKALVTVSVSVESQERLAKALARQPEVEAVYMTTGRSITARVALERASDLNAFLKKNLTGKPFVDRITSEVITGVVKEDPPSIDPDALVMNLKCDYCGGPVTSQRPFTLSLSNSPYYFCCKTCKAEYLDEHGERLGRVSRRALSA